MAKHLLILLLLLSLSASGAERRLLQGTAMGTRWMTLLSDAADLDSVPLETAIRDRLELIERAMSTWRPDSEISRFNAFRGTNWFSVSGDFAWVLGRALKIARASGGAFDPTIYPIVRLWGFDGRQPDMPPSESEVAEVMARVGFEGLEVRIEPPAIRKRNALLEIDLSAIAKGFAVDRVAALLDERGFGSWLVDIGGELRARGISPRGGPWRVGIEAPVVGRRVIHETVELKQGGVATSGDYRNFIVLGGRRHAHLIDPRRGLPIPQSGLAVSVMAGDCLTADAWATALCVLGPADGLIKAELEGLAALFLVQSPDGETEARRTRYWPGAR
jgi:thiamine biosynthesis lipoprotein